MPFPFFYLPSAAYISRQSSFYTHIPLSLFIILIVAKSIWYLLIYNINYRQKYIIFVFLSLTYLSQHDDLKFYTFSCQWHNFILLYGWLMLYGIYISYFFYPFISSWIPSLIPDISNLNIWNKRKTFL
jgi:hypothetical protein